MNDQEAGKWAVKSAFVSEEITCTLYCTLNESEREASCDIERLTLFH